MTNDEIADRLLLFAALLELNGADAYACRAYRRGADVIRAAPVDIEELVREGRVRELRGIGRSIEAKLRELVETGEIAELRELEATLRPDLAALGRHLGLSATRMLALCGALGIETPDDLRAAAAAGRLRDAPGIGAVTEQRIVEALAREARPRRGLRLDESWELLSELAARLGGAVAGDARRYCPLCYDLAVVCASADPGATLDRFAALPAIVTHLERGDGEAVGLTIEGLPVRLVVASPETFGTALVRATGSAAYVSALEPLPDAPDEDAVFAALGLQTPPPELRDEPVDVPADLVEIGDVRGDLHCHTTWSDGRSSVLEMAAAARDRGYEYLAICDHTPSVRVVPGLDADALRRQGEEIDQANDQLAPFRVLKGIECDILPDGSLDLADAILERLDWVQISLHAGQRRSGAELTRIVSEAMRRPHVRALSHPTGRILNYRPENALDLDEVYSVAVETGVALEINGLASRLDLSAEHARNAVRGGVRLVLGSDAHSAGGLRSIELAVRTARRAGVRRPQIVNGLALAEVLRRSASASR